MSAEALTWAFRQGGGHSFGESIHTIKPPARFVLVTLADRANHEGVCWPGYTDIAYRTGYSVRRVQQLINALVRAGLVERVQRTGQHGRQTSNLYVLHLERGVRFAEIGRRVQRVAEYVASMPREPMVAGDEACGQVCGQPVDESNIDDGKFRGRKNTYAAPESDSIPPLSADPPNSGDPKISPLESSIEPPLVTGSDLDLIDKPVDNNAVRASMPAETHSAPSGAQEVRQDSQALPTAPAWRHLLAHEEPAQ